MRNLGDPPAGESVPIRETDWWKGMEKDHHSGKTMRVYRENAGWSQSELGTMLGGLSRQRVYDLETGRRSISKDMAKKLAAVFDKPVERFL